MGYRRLQPPPVEQSPTPAVQGRCYMSIVLKPRLPASPTPRDLLEPGLRVGLVVVVFVFVLILVVSGVGITLAVYAAAAAGAVAAPLCRQCIGFGDAGW
jgi:hypothetical protein